MQASYYPQRLFADQDYALVLLNREIKINTEFFLRIWNNACVRHVVDGGANRFLGLVKTLPANLQETVKFPEIATGDFDSITDESMSTLKNDVRSKCQIIPTEDQDNTDFTKGLAELHTYLESSDLSSSVRKVIVLCEFTGRLDQIIGNLNTLHKNAFLQDKPAEKRIQVIVLGSSSLTWLLPAGIPISVEFQDEVPNLYCGVMPFMGPTTYTSTGLKWNLTPDMVCQFGGLVGTSNIIIEKNVEITSIDNHSVLTIDIHYSKYIL